MVLETTKSETADDFVSRLEKLPSDISEPDFSNPWVYRGQSDAAWALEPSAWHSRGLKKLKPLQEWVRVKVEACLRRRPMFELWAPSARQQNAAAATQIATEVMAVRQFCDLADELGIAVPGAEQLPEGCDVIGLAIDDVTTPLVIDEGPYTQLFPCDTPYAFAQHHGIPTRYLDWTREPLVAAFFASWDVRQGAREICVWATKPNEVVGVRWATIPRAQHSYLHAQSGLFSCIEPRSLNQGNMGHWPKQDRVLEEAGASLHKYTLSAEQAPQVLRILFAKHVSRAHLMPVLDNVAHVSVDRWRWLQHSGVDATCDAALCAAEGI